MPKGTKIDKPKKKPGRKKRKKFEQPKVKVYLPGVIPGRGPNEEIPPPSEYELDYEDAMLAVKMEKLAAKGLTNDQIIELLPISRDTFYKRLKENPYFSYCLMKHREKAIEDVEYSLYKAANGFEYLEQAATANGRVVNLLKAKTPDVNAIKFFLTNRASEKWKNKVETTHQAGESMGGMVFAIKRREE